MAKLVRNTLKIIQLKRMFKESHYLFNNRKPIFNHILIWKLFYSKSKIIIANEKKQTRNKAEKEFYRGSQFRGVSINGNRWQVFIIIKNKKYYAGQMDTEVEAAKLYDKLIILHGGLTVKTNFSYSAQDLKELINISTDRKKKSKMTLQ